MKNNIQNKCTNNNNIINKSNGNNNNTLQYACTLQMYKISVTISNRCAYVLLKMK